MGRKGSLRGREKKRGMRGRWEGERRRKCKRRRSSRVRYRW